MSGKFEPKAPVTLNKPLSVPYGRAQLLQFNGEITPYRYIGIKGVVYDVTANVGAYGPGTKYSALLGRDASRALGKSSLKEEDLVSSDISDLTERQLQVLDDWVTFFSKRYNVVGVIVGP